MKNNSNFKIGKKIFPEMWMAEGYQSDIYIKTGEILTITETIEDFDSIFIGLSCPPKLDKLLCE